MTTEARSRVCADVERLPFRHRAFDMVWSNLVLHWTDASRVLREVHRVLRPGGVFMFSTLGPDTLKELRASYSAADGFEHVNRFVDLHDVGDMLVGSRFADPVMDMEQLTLTYETVDALLSELRAGGAGNANAGRPPGLSGRKGHARMRAAYEQFRADGRLPATFEVVYGHAWRSQTDSRTPEGEAVVALHPRRTGGPRR
jgi:malonyl-CoA O-methyltransferase